ncbi:peptidoglycan recognition family protein [Paenibacillus sp. NEAU-GSW1]|uniref:peptidoglycan recognition protein family protein n=1 Tax=Paenibacillus sp. NEAU-GSW1 TaxID=2682486 RepID=UPI001C12BC43|nr:peptidoglycan recognition family protein [Paenibacillus sp. NEAU-GSW1]
MEAITISKVFKRYTLDEFIAYLQTFVGQVRFNEVHVHGTWKPTIANFRERPGDYYMHSMYRAHLQRGFTDIAQHATIDPDGYIWDGRPLLVPPASATGYNDSDDDRVHPFMFEMIGNFDKGVEKLDGAQLETAVGLTRAIVSLFGSRIVFHREMNPLKTCPGSGVDKDTFVALVNAAIKPPATAKPVISAEDANKIIKFLSAGYSTTSDAEARAEFNRLANELRKASGQKLQ